MGTNEYADDFRMTFSEPSGFLEFLRERNRRVQWKRWPANELSYAVLEKEDVSGPHGDYSDEQWKAIAEDTKAHTRLILQTEYGNIPIRECAVRTMLRRADISGKALPRLDRSVYAQVLNYCMEVAEGNALVCISDGKVSAVHDGDGRGYTVLEIPELVRVLMEYLEGAFPKSRFSGGYYDHSIVTATWELDGEEKLIRQYQEVLDQYGLESNPLVPSLRFTCSDIGVSGANLYPTLVVGRAKLRMPLGNPLRQVHKGKASLQQFRDRLPMLYAQFEQGVKNVEKLLGIVIANPANCMTAVCKMLELPQKLALPAIERFRAQNGTKFCTAYELYCAICEILYDLRCEGADGYRLAQMEENIARAVHVRWEEYDIEGNISW